MGNLYRFVEPVLLFLLKKKGRSYGYQLASELRAYALTDSEVEVAALYKTLRQLEKNNCVTSEWDVKGSGPARRVYALTPWGEQHLDEWVTVVGHMSKAMARFVRSAQAIQRPAPAAKTTTSRATSSRVSQT
jgi:PadR family transcriptional regulator